MIPSFTFGLHGKDLALLYQIQSYFGIGLIRTHKDGYIYYSVKSAKDLISIIIPHFDKYPLMTQKRSDFELFKLALELINKKQHLTIEGLEKLVAIKGAMNLGLPKELKVSFPGTSLVERPKVLPMVKLDPDWLVGFIEAEGCFLVEVSASKTHKLSYQVKFNFSISQHTKDALLMESLIKFLDCGHIASRSADRKIAEYRVVSLNDITGKIIPFLQKYPLQGYRQIDF